MISQKNALQDAGLHPPAAAPETQALNRELSARLKGEVRFDSTSRELYATDASIYRIVPVGVVVPRDEADVVAAVRIAAAQRVPVLPRGSGTSLGGQAVGAALVLDFTKYMHDVLELNVGERWVRVQPGVILDELNLLLKPHGLMFAPDVATSNRASIGGMMGNNSCGAHSIMFGRTVDHVVEQRAILSDGSAAIFSELAPEEWRRRGEGSDLESSIYREVRRICGENAAEVEARFPHILRRGGGYALDEITRHGRLSLARLSVGSEGTLCTVTEAKLNLVPTPKCAGLLVSHFADLLEALEAVPAIVAHRPAAVELTDRIIMDLTRENLALSRARTFLTGEPEALLATEIYGDTPQEVEERLEAIRAELGASKVGYAHALLLDAARQKDFWDVRKAGMGLLMGMKGDAKPVGFVEDTAVAPERLADYIREFRGLMDEYGLSACYYAHASVGCLHIRPILNLKDPGDQGRMREIASRVVDLVLKYGGAMSAEHGDGLVRSEWQERMFGSQLYQAFREVKAAFDPSGIMNPGKIVDAPPMTENLRFGADYRTLPVHTHFDYARDGGFAGAVEMCTGVGACRKKTDGTMCPSFRATLEEEHSTRGRANVLRAVLTGVDGAKDLADPRLHEALDLCLECKACKSECPSNVDMAKLKYECLAHWNDRHGTPLRSMLLANAATAGRVGALLAPFSNWLIGLPMARALLERCAGIDRRRALPSYARETFETWWRRRTPNPHAGDRGEVLLLADTFTNYHEPQVGRAAVRVLEAFGYRVRLPPLKCCGRPLISKGMLRQARENAAHNVAVLAEAHRAGLPIVGLEPSCIVSLRDEYADFGLGPDAALVASRSSMLEDFLAERHAGGGLVPFRETRREVRLHGHCHQKAVFGTHGALAALRMVPGYEVAEIPSGCCGMAGTFGYEREHYDLSLSIGELSLLPHVRAAPVDALIVASGTSCRHQIRDMTGRRAVHAAEALALALDESAI